MSEAPAKKPRRKKTQPRVRRPPKQPNDRSRMWHSMRILREFTAQAVAAAADCPVRSVRTYINLLRQIGYVIVVRKSRYRLLDHTVYQLSTSTGPHAPRVRANGKSILDLNTLQEVPRVRA